ncbi:hypothetical protein SEA_SHARKBOY_57 [Microbacterium phage Sharkboy]|uniref:Uncharacterized protein n=1 Tax=Microbacterium phage Sharkboy TaxID=2590938 RepID=A0A516KUD7_9CAUD|nr:hypothetical protein SEA_SHARKBOY_57 [Microbacterium phage Sharkboy]
MTGGAPEPAGYVLVLTAPDDHPTEPSQTFVAVRAPEDEGRLFETVEELLAFVEEMSPFVEGTLASYLPVYPSVAPAEGLADALRSAL